MLIDMKFIVFKTRGRRFESGSMLKKNSACGGIGRHSGNLRFFNRLLLRKNVVDLKFIVNKRGPQNWRFESFCADNICISMM